MSVGTQVVETKRQNPVEAFKGQMHSRASEFQAALPAHIPVERFMRVVNTAVIQNPTLLQCDRVSLFTSAMKAAQDGLLPDGRDAALIPFKNQVQYMPMIAGVLKKIRNSGILKTISAHVAYEKDEFFYRLGDDEKIEHTPFMDGDRGKPKLVYAVAHTKDGGVYREVMTVAQVEKVRAVSRAGASGPWKDWWEEMARKTVIRRLSKRLPMSTDLDDLLRQDDALYDLQGAGDAHVRGPRLSMTAALDQLAAPATIDQPARGATAEFAEADYVEDERGNVVKDKNPEATSSSDAEGGTAEGEGSGGPSAASDFPGDKPMKQAPDFEALLAEFERDAPNATTEEELGELAADLRQAMDEHPPSREFQTKAANAWQDQIDRINGKGTKAASTPTNGDQNDPDFKRGWADAEKGVRRCLKQDIRDNPDRLAKWQAGFDAFTAQGSEG